MTSSRGATTSLLPGSGEGDGTLALLVVAEGPPIVAPLAAGRDLRIGRGSNADVTLDDSSLSRLHAVFRVREGWVEVEDLGSSNGTIVRGARIRSATRVEVGETVTLGTVLVVVQLRAGSVADRLRPAATPSDELVKRIATSTISVLLLGETGVGKEVMAERLHTLSPRRAEPFVKLNCAALMTSVLESELFGHERGAFTGAIKDKPGLVESADGGTLFLDEIGEADLAVQVKLLRILETRETQRIGALRPRIVDVRFIAATNRVPQQQIEAGTLRADLYYRLAGFTLTIAPLRERRDELPGIAATLLARHGSYTLDASAVERLSRLPWPGNVRELRNVLDRAVVLADGSRIDLDMIDAALGMEPPFGERATGTPAPSASDPEQARVLSMLDACGGNQTMAAERLGISRRSLVYRLQAWGMTKPRRR